MSENWLNEGSFQHVQLHPPDPLTTRSGRDRTWTDDLDGPERFHSADAFGFFTAKS